MSYTHLSSEERYVISYLVLYGLSLREISRRLNRHHSTISREIKRNRPTYADDAVYWYVGLWDVLGFGDALYIYRFEIMILLRVKAKSLLCYWAVRDLGIGMVQIARRLN